MRPRDGSDFGLGFFWKTESQIHEHDAPADWNEVKNHPAEDVGEPALDRPWQQGQCS